jgi:hypothetical protein
MTQGFDFQPIVFVSIRNNNGKVVSRVCFDFEPSRREIRIQNNNKMIAMPIIVELKLINIDRVTLLIELGYRS